MGLSDLWNLAEKVARAVWPVVSVLIGVLVGAYIANRNQKKQWVSDNKKQEYRELMTALAEAFNAVVDETVPSIAYGPEEQRAFATAKTTLVITIGDRIFIAQELKEMKFLGRWNTAVVDFHNTHDENVFTETFVGITADIVKAASRLSD
jgi:hypothetical protein